MNTKFFILALVLFFQFSFLNAQTGNCVVVSPTGDNFYLALDGKFQSEKASSNIKITGIPEGDYWATVFFDDANKKAFKTNLRVLENKETTYNIENSNGIWKLQETSTVSKSQTGLVNTNQTILVLNETGATAKGYKNASEIPKASMQTQDEITRVQGDKNDIESKRMGTFSGGSETIDNNNTVTKSDIESKRMGNFSSNAGNTTENNNSNTTTTTAPQTGTTTVSQYIKVENADGTTSIVEEQVITEKEIVERNGQKQLKTKKSTVNIPTDFTCLPMAKESFIALKESMEKAAVDARLAIAENGIKDQCLTPAQIKTLGDLILGEVDRNTFAIAAKPTCAEADKFPYQITEPIAVQEQPKEVVKEEVVVETKEETPKTKEQLKAELNALKAKEKADKAAAKQKEKEAKAAAKAEAKKKKDEEKAAKAKK